MKIAFRRIKSAVLGVKLERSICLNRIGAALVLLLLMPALSHAAGILQVEDLTAPNLIGDSNVESGGQNLPGPDVLTIGAKACNVGDQQLRDVTLYVGDGTTPGEFPDTIVPPATRPYEGTFELVMLDADRSDATRVVGFLDPGSCLTAYWQAQYPVVDANIDATWGLQNTDADDLALDFSVWGTSFDVPTGAPSNSVVNDTVTVRNEQDANPNKVSPTPGAVTVITPASAQVGVGEILTIEFQNATFGNINQGFDVDPADGQPDHNLWFQPVGETTWNTDVLRLVRVDAELRGASCGAGRPDVAITLVDDWHESGFDQYGTCSWDADYTYTFIALGPGVTATSPYQEASSGSNQEKFNGDYCGDSDPFTSPTSACFTLTALPGNPTLVKSVDKAVAVEGETLTYNLAYENTSTNSVGDPSSGNGIVIRDSIPSGIDYVAGSASSSAACTIRYSSDNGLTFDSVEPSPASLVTDLHFYLSDPIPGGATGTVTFQGIVETGFTGRITNIGEIAITGSAAITTDNAETLVGCEFDSDCDDGAYCNGAETCVSGACTAGTPVSCDDGQACTTESCNEATDSCDYTTNDAVCDDADACNGAETCVAGVGCQAGTPLVCDDSNECTTDSCNAIAGCQYANASAGTACGDGTDNDCTDPDTCDGAGSCQSNHASAGANAPTQCNDSVECTADQCDGSGGCQNPNLSAGTACGDGSDTDCTNPDTCDGAGSCQSNHESSGFNCGDGTNTDCTDPDTCDGAGTCQSNHASAGAAAAAQCNDSNECTLDQCDGAGGCQNPAANAGTTCGDGTDNDCTDPDTCDGSGSCQSNHASAGTTAATQCNDSVECTADQCDGAGGCQNPAASAGTPCGDGTNSDCTDPDTCDGAGTCQSNHASAGTAAATQCDDSQDCTADQCDGTGGCQYANEPAGISCGDPSDTECTDPDTCDGAGGCTSHDQPSGTVCGDQSSTECTLPDTCNALGICQPNDAAAGTSARSLCNDLNTCTRDQCDGTGGCRYEALASGRSCNDPADDGCDTTPDTCDGTGLCQANEPAGNTDCTFTDLALEKLEPVGTAELGGFVDYLVRVSNLGPNDAGSVVVTDYLDPNTAYVASTPPCVEEIPGRLTCPLGSLVVGATIEFGVTVRVNDDAPTAGVGSGSPCPVGSDLCNRAIVSSDRVDTDWSNNEDEAGTDATPITQSADLLTTKVDITPEHVAPGDQVLYEIRVTNLGPDEATDVVLHESLDPHMIYVSDSHGCSASGTPTQLTCALGNIANGASVVFQVTVDIDPNSPIASGLQDGDCYNAEDLCNTVTVSARTSDPSLDNNHDSEPTDASTNPTCGDGIINGADQCDPPSAETCTNGVDDNGDNLIDCADPLCAYPATSCDGNCQLTTACLPILDDPAKLTWNYVKIHGRFVPGTPVDPENEGFTFMLSNANGLIYRAELFAADLRFAGGKSTKRWKFRDKFAKRGMGSRKGLSTISMKTRNEPDGSVSYPFKVKAYGDMSNATVALMTTQISVGDDVSFVTEEWKGKPGHWRLYKSQF